MENCNKPIILCGVTDMYGNPIKMTEEEQNEFTKKVGGNEYCAIFCDTHQPFPLYSVKQDSNENK